MLGDDLAKSRMLHELVIEVFQRELDDRTFFIRDRGGRVGGIFHSCHRDAQKVPATKKTEDHSLLLGGHLLDFERAV